MCCILLLDMLDNAAAGSVCISGSVNDRGFRKSMCVLVFFLSRLKMQPLKLGFKKQGHLQKPLSVI